MANTSSIDLTSLDFESLRNSFKNYMKGRDEFADYDFDGSNISMLMDLLAYNTYMNSFYLNQVASEGFLDSAKLRDSLVSHAKELNYTPRSFTSAQATINITIKSSNLNKTSITVPKGTGFVGRIGSNNYTFTTAENIVINGAGTFTAQNVEIYEGAYLRDSFNSGSEIILNNPNIDTNSLSVYVVEDSGANVLEYLRATSLFGYTSNSRIFFVEGAFGSKYKIIFGDDVIGRKPKENSVIIAEYRTSKGELPNNISKFTPIGSIDGETNITVTTVNASHSGSVSESNESIRYNAPRHFTTQERAVTTEDYENLLKLNFPEINAVTAFGGETVTPPVFGKVYISIDLNEIDGLPESKRDQYYNFIKPRSPLSIDPIFIDPEYLYVQVNTEVSYNINTTDKSDNDIRTIVISSILDYAQNNLNDFAKTLRYSRLLEQIDNSDQAVISNQTNIKAIKNIDTIKLATSSILVDLKFPIQNISSSNFYFKNVLGHIESDTDGSLNVVTPTAKTKIGTVDFVNGSILLNAFTAASTNNLIRLIITPTNSDIITSKNTIINILDSDIIVKTVQARQ